MDKPLLATAINRHCVDKMADRPDLSRKENLRRWYDFNMSFEDDLLTVAGLHEAVAAGHSFCPRHRHQQHRETRTDGTVHMTSYRHHLNYLPTSVFGIDIDNGSMTLDQLEHDQFFHAYGCYGYTTPSHTEAHPRIRAVFALESPVQKLDNFRLLKRAVAMYFGADPCDANPMHAYSGNRTSSFFHVSIPENRLPIAVARTKIQELQEYLESERQRQARKAQARMRDENTDFPNADDIAEMLRHLPKEGEYLWWVKVLMAIHSECPDETGIELAEAWSPGYAGEIEEKFRSFGRREYGPSIGWLITAAKAHGYVPRPVREAQMARVFGSFLQASRR